MDIPQHALSHRVIWLVLGRWGIISDRRRLLTIISAFVLSFLDPVQITLFLGQVNLLLMLLVIADLVVLRNNKWMGIGIGLATAVKLTPGIFFIYLLATKRYRAAVTGILMFATVSLLALAIAPGDSVTYWGGEAYQLNRFQGAEDIHSQSILSFTVRALHGADSAMVVGVVLSVLVGITGVWLAAVCSRHIDDMVGIGMCGLAGTVASPIAWGHYWVWVVPIIVASAVLAWRNKSWPAWLGVLALTAIFYLRPYEYGLPLDTESAVRLDVSQILRAGSYTLASIAIMIVVAAILANPCRWASEPGIKTFGFL
jgi:alpha-1,2-mannosyltransferase